MFKRHDTRVSSNAVCLNAVENLLPEDFNYYDKDGFELNVAEQKFYSAMGFPINYPILNHCCWQEPWFELEQGNKTLLLDHSMILARCEYARDALAQIKEFVPLNPYAQLLTKVKSKWGFDFALDAVADNGAVYEVIHIEYDNYHYDIFNTRRLQFDYLVRHTDWEDAAQRIWQQRDKWVNLQGFEQNHWKANYLIGWEKAEYVEKAL
jgi:hypothetical protein